MITTLHDIKLKTLKNIFAGCLDFKYDIIDNYDFTQPDGCLDGDGVPDEIDITF